MSLNATEQAILNVITSDVATVAGQPIVTLLQALKAANGNIALQQAAVLQFIGEAPALGLQLGIEFEAQAINAVLGKLQAFLATKASVASTAKT